MARRRKKGKRSKKGKFYLSSVVLPMDIALRSYAVAGTDLKAWAYEVPFQVTGYDFKSGSGWNSSVAIRNVGLAVGLMVSHKLASKVGLNRQVKKLTMGLIGGW